MSERTRGIKEPEERSFCEEASRSRHRGQHVKEKVEEVRWRKNKREEQTEREGGGEKPEAEEKETLETREDRKKVLKTWL